ncbi:ATP-dependent Clp protease ATP-binding subunit ClpA [Rhodococcus sp. 27YEA15]|uniref:Clp protease N-terminal domain-containing protein n=1 Tax=Rhodococcus sp. 27YEA15 TaxID=3156259 RepID=UPI003C7ED869
MFERFTADARDVVIDAVAGSPKITPIELLTALLVADRGIATATLVESGVTLDAVRTPRDDDAALLESIGIDLSQVRRSLERSFGAGVFDNARIERPRRRGPHLERESRKVLELSLREAQAHKSKQIGAEHILLGILRVADGHTRTVLQAHTSIDGIRRRLEEKMNRAA